MLQPPSPYEVRCPVHGSIPFDEAERRIIDHPLVQRLRYISQLGFASLVFPGATHSRFSHSLGVMHLAGRIFERLVAGGGLREGPEALPAERLAYLHRVVRLAALLHDAGHAPFSHTFEPLLPDRSRLALPAAWFRGPLAGQATHEDCSVAAVHALAEEQPDALPPGQARDVAALIHADVIPTAGLTGDGGPAANLYPLLKQVISGEIDADRMDYLRRDALFAGVTYGQFDQERLIQSLGCTLTGAGWVMTLDRSGLFTYENFLMARFHMAMQVYFHKTLLPFEYFLRRAVEEGEIDLAVDGRLDNLLAAREDRVYALLYAARDQRWSGAIVHRRPVTRLLELGDAAEPATRERVFQALEAAGVDVIHIREERRLSSQGQEENGSAYPIYVRHMRLGETMLEPLPEASGLLQRYNLPFTIENLYCDPADYERGCAALRDVLAG